MKKKMIAIVIVLAMLLATMPTVYAEECAHTTLDRYSRCVDCGLGVCPDCRVAPKQIYYMVTEATCEGEGVWTLFCQSTPCREASGKTLVTKRGTVPALGHSDENSDHYCDRCHKAFCVDVNPYDHKCDYCQTILSECADVSPCDHKCDICRAVISECRDEDPLDHKCDICQKVLSECRDAAPPDYICDVCGQAVSEHTTEGCTHIDIDAYRICGNCKKPVCPKCNGTPEGYEITSQPSCETTGMIVMMCVCQNTPTKTVVSIIPALGHTDANKDHTCDRCGKTSCTDDNPADHQCDVCQTVLSECVDESRVDHKCDICRKVLSECVDEDPEDHKCDVCQTVLSECVDESPADHMCDVCGKVLSECLDDDPVDLKCDICGAAVPEKPCAHVNIDNYRICQRCKQPICPKCGGVPEGYEVKTQPACETDGMIVMMCICQNTLTKIVTWTIPALGHIDENHDHICDRSACGTTLSACADTDPKDHQCDICGKVLSGHTGGTATCTAKAVCSHCGEAYGELKADGHTGEARWTQTADQHEKKWSCCGAVVVSPEDHTWENGTCQECGYVCRQTGGTATCTAKAVCEECGEVYGELKADGHTGEARWTQTADQHE
ncbi:MAG: hypothetical protein SOW80_02340, partial [Anaerovoracaceae bacterium]|nr:hypothetical protein [Anaerovoracaceae bacterium]